MQPAMAPIPTYLTIPNQPAKGQKVAILINSTKSMGQISDSFNDVACSGAATNVVEAEIDSGSATAAIPEITHEFGTPDIVSVNDGGDNDEIFFNTINACVVALTDFDQTNQVYQQNCSDHIKKALNTITTLQPKLEAVHSHAKVRNLLPGQKRSVYVLGYAQFYSLNTMAKACRPWYSSDIPVSPLGPNSIGSAIYGLVLASWSFRRTG